jgi:formate hydrogenlyase transcriptional activator
MMATAAVVDYRSYSSRSGDERLQPESGSRIELHEFANSGCDGASDGFEGIVGSSPDLLALLDQVRIVAPTGATVLIEGETGTGKELVAHAIHMHSERRRRPFVKVNCAAIPTELLESELFGHERGAFTGALAQRIGRFEAAHGGTLFLDEIGDMPLHLQTKLLRVLQEQEFERVGGNRTIRVDVRIIAATNRDLKAMVEENKFRADLYYRLAVFPLNVPPLRERRQDIAVLTRHFVQKHARRMNRKIEHIPTDVLKRLTNYDWPGNIRELQNVIERSVILSDGHELCVPLLDLDGRSDPVAPSDTCTITSEASERERILKVLKETNGIVAGANGAASRLGLKRTTLQSRMRKYNIARVFK